MEFMNAMGTSKEIGEVVKIDWYKELENILMVNQQITPDDVVKILENHKVAYTNLRATVDRAHFCVGGVGIKVALNAVGIGKNVREWYLIRNYNLLDCCINVRDTNGIIQITDAYEMEENYEGRPWKDGADYRSWTSGTPWVVDLHKDKE